jgi:hypothetical protein
MRYSSDPPSRPFCGDELMFVLTGIEKIGVILLPLKLSDLWDWRDFGLDVGLFSNNAEFFLTLVGEMGLIESITDFIYPIVYTFYICLWKIDSGY